ncbi:MAG TPA: hypothetical protein VFX70_23575 [Mycobacteriales bacterium]|nr:hypothetical protein [Mycobacteriales bacterium]
MVDSDGSRGSFAGTAELVRRIAPTLWVQDPAAVRAHGIELFTLAPELWAPVGLPGEDLALPGEMAATQPQGFSRLETWRIAHGLVDLLHAWAATVGHSVVVYDNVGRADPTELELLAVAVRGLPAELVELVVCSTRNVGEPLAGALRRHAARVDVASGDRVGGGLSLTSR